MAGKKKSTPAKKPTSSEVRRKAVRLLIPEELVQQMDELVKLEWFPSREYIIERALRKFVHSNRPELLEKAIWEDVEWGLRGK